MEKRWFVGQGSAAVDTILYCAVPLEVDGLIGAEREVVTSGGSGANLMAAAAAMGVPSALAAKVGDDALGVRFRRELVADGVSDRYLIEQKGGVTLHTYIAVGPRGERSIIVAPGACGETLTLSELPEDLLDEAFLFFTDGSPRALATDLVRLARKKGVPVFYQRECVDRPLGGAYQRQGEELLHSADLVAGGPDTYAQLVGTEEPEPALRAFYDRYRPAHGAIMTAGRRGAFWFDGEELLHHPIFPVKSIDSTGAGDAFCGGLVDAYFFRGRYRRDALRFASACGAIQCTIPGPRFRATRAQVEAFLDDRGEEGI